MDVWPAQMRSMANVSNSYSSLHAGCLAKYTAEPERCLFPQYYAELIETRTMLVQSLYDSSELWYTLMLDCCAGSCSGYPTCKSGGTERSQLFALRHQHMDAWKPLVNRPGKPSERTSSVRESLCVPRSPSVCPSCMHQQHQQHPTASDGVASDDLPCH